jgi:hypothetical protein
MFDALASAPPTSPKPPSTSDLDAQVAHRAGKRGKVTTANTTDWAAVGDRMQGAEQAARERHVKPSPVVEHRRSYDPAAAQAELEEATDQRVAEAMRALAAISRKNDREAYDRARAELVDARTAYDNVRTFTKL